MVTYADKSSIMGHPHHHMNNVKIYHYTNLTFVSCESGRSQEAIRPKLKTFLSLHCWT